MKQYLDLVNEIVSFGDDKSDRTGTGTKSIFGYQMRFDLSKGFPLVTVKKSLWKDMVRELLWFISGSVKVQDLRDMGCTFWDEWEKKDGTIGPGYGKMLRNIDYGWNRYDQLSQVIKSIKTNPFFSFSSPKSILSIEPE